MNCLGCNFPIGDDELLKCSMCKDGIYHYKCCNISEQTYNDQYLIQKLRWSCPACANITRRYRNDNTPVHSREFTPTPNMQLNSSCMSCDDDLPENGTPVQKSPPTSVHHSSAPAQFIPAVQMSTTLPGSNHISYDRFETLLDTKLDFIKKSIATDISTLIRKEITTAIDKLQIDFTKTTDFLKEEQDDLKRDLKLANDRIKTLENEKSGLQSNINNINRRLLSLEKSSRSHNLEIQCVPESKSENLLAIVKKMYEIVKLPISDNEICSVRRVAKLNPKSDRPRNILLTLQSELQRDNLLSAAARYNKNNHSNPLCSSQLGIQGENRKIYVCEHLSFECKELHAATRKFAREHSYTYVWVKYGRVYLRKEDDSTAIHVKDFSVLEKLSK